jgi:hypothetical protein
MGYYVYDCVSIHVELCKQFHVDLLRIHYKNPEEETNNKKQSIPRLEVVWGFCIWDNINDMGLW